MRLALITVLFSLGLSLPLTAQSTFTCNSDGYVQTSSGNQPAYFGKSCDFYTESVGGGNWCQLGSSIFIEVQRGPTELSNSILPICPAFGDGQVPCSCDTDPLPSGYTGN